MLKGFKEGNYYVVMERLADGRLLCHELGDDSSLKIVPIGTRVLNKLNFSSFDNLPVVYDGININAYKGSYLRCEKDDAGVYLSGLFIQSSDDVFSEGETFTVCGFDDDKNIVVSDSSSKITKRIPKGVELSIGTYDSWVYEEDNTEITVGSTVVCSDITASLSFLGSFLHKGQAVSDESNKCPACGYEIEGISGKYTVKSLSGYSMVGCDVNTCPECGSIFVYKKSISNSRIKSNQMVVSITREVRG